MARCLTCNKEVKDFARWCTMDCKKVFYMSNFAENTTARQWDEEHKLLRIKNQNSKEYLDFMDRVKNVGFTQALRELKEFKEDE